MLRMGVLGVVLAVLSASATGCVVKENYLLPYPALATLNTLSSSGTDRLATTAVTAQRDTGDEVFLRADTLDLNRAEQANGESVRVTSTKERSKLTIGLEIGAMVVGAAAIGLGAWLFTDGQSQNDTGLTAGGGVLMGVGAAGFAVGTVMLGITLGTRPQELGADKSGYLYLDRTGRIPNTTGAWVGFRFQ